MRIGFYQFRPRFGEAGFNTAAIIKALRRVRADLIVVPELALSGYYFSGRREARALAEDPRRSLHVGSLIDLCRDRGLYLVVGFAEKSRDRIFNSSLLLGPGGLLETYRKIHLFNNEKSWFDPGDGPLRVKRLRGVRVGMMICFDWLFPEVTRALALKGLDVLAHPSNLVLPHCQQSMRTRCLENGIFAVTANRFGEDRRPHGSVAFTGRSQITGPGGQVIRQAPARRVELHVHRIDPSDARRKKITPRNHRLRDRRPSFYTA
jgi:predicted amidohydrolase